MKIGKFYEVQEYFWFLYPSIELAIDGGRSGFKPNPFMKKGDCFVLLDIQEYTSFRLSAPVIKMLSTSGDTGWSVLKREDEEHFKEINPT